VVKGTSVRRLSEELDRDDEVVFLDALYPSRTPQQQTQLLERDRRTSQDPSVVLAMTAVLRHRDRALIVRRSPTSITAPAPPPVSFMAPPAPPRLQELRGGLFDPIRSATNTALLREHQAQTEVWADTVETYCRAEAMAVALAVGKREAAARIAAANAVIAEAEFRQQQSEMSNRLLNDTFQERRDLARAITNIYSIEGGEPS
jgi:hypothetical protein